MSVLKSGEVVGLSYYVMPHVQGESLRKLIERAQGVSLDEIIRITGQVADGLAYTRTST